MNSRDAKQSSWLKWLSLAGRLLGGFVIVAMIGGGTEVGLLALLKTEAVDQPQRILWFALAVSLIAAAVVLATYAGFVRLTERDWPFGLSPRMALLEISAGLAGGLVLGAACAPILFLMGAYRPGTMAPFAQWASLLLSAAPLPIIAAATEEALFRGVILRQIARSGGPWLGLGISSLIFGLLHAGIPEATLLVGVGLVVQAGLLLGIVYLVTGRLWAAIGLHAGWNFFQAGIMGAAVSGQSIDPIVRADPIGPHWLSGGSFGIEGSVVTTGICLALSVAILGFRGFRLTAPR